MIVDLPDATVIDNGTASDPSTWSDEHLRLRALELASKLPAGTHQQWTANAQALLDFIKGPTP